MKPGDTCAMCDEECRAACNKNIARSLVNLLPWAIGFVVALVLLYILLGDPWTSAVGEEFPMRGVVVAATGIVFGTLGITQAILHANDECTVVKRIGR